MSAEELLKFINDNPTMSPHVGVIEECLTKQEFDDWKVFEKDYQEEDETLGEDSTITDIKMHHGPLLRAGHARLERARKSNNTKKTTKAANAMEVLVENYIEAVEELGGNTGSMILIDGYTAVAPDYIAQHLVEPVYILRSWATGIGSTIGKKTSKRDKLIEFLEMVTDTYTDVPLAELIATMSDNVAVHTPATIEIKRPDPWSHDLFDNPKKK